MRFSCRIRLELETPVRCTDGAFGALADLVIDPTSHRVTHLVVRPGDSQVMVGSRLVPIERVRTGEPNEEIELGCTVEEMAGFEPVQEFTYLRLDGFPVDDPDWDVGIANVLAMPFYGPGGELGAIGYDAEAGMTYDRVPKDEVEIRRASEVISSDGHSLGHVEAFIVDQDGQVTHFVLERGHLWGRRDVTIPIGAIARFETDVVTLSLSKDDVGELPTVRVSRW